MKEFDVADVIKEVRIAIDQNMSSETLIDIGDVDTLSIEDIIRSKIADAARVVELNAPSMLLDGGKAFGDSIGWNSEAGYGSGHIILPEDFLRLVTFQMSDWSYAVTQAITEEDPLYLQQHSRFPGIRGCPQRPVVAIITQPVGQVLEFFSCTAGEDVFVKRARYIPIPTIKEEKIELCEKLKPAIVYYAAYMTALSIGDETLASVMQKQCKEIIGIE